MKHQAKIQAAIAGLLALGVGLPSAAATAHDVKAPPGKEKCYGVSKAGQNDCGTTKHACATMGKADNDPTDWKFVPQGSCEKMGGKTTAPPAPKG